MYELLQYGQIPPSLVSEVLPKITETELARILALRTLADSEYDFSELPDEGVLEDCLGSSNWKEAQDLQEFQAAPRCNLQLR